MSAVLVLVDLQKEYITPNSPFCLDHIEPALENLRKLQDHARKNDWLVVHIKHQQNSDFFGYGSPNSEFIEGFEPIGDEKEMVKQNFSCFTSPEFTALIDKYRNMDVVLAGFSSAMCCLSTLIGAHHRGYEFLYVSDATGAKRTEHYDELTVTGVVLDVAKAYGHVVTTQEVLDNM